MKVDVIREQLNGLERRNKERSAKRKLSIAEHLERKRKGQARTRDRSVYVPNWKV